MEYTVPQDQKDLLFQQTYFKALLENNKNLTQWKEYKETYDKVIENLKYYNEKHQHSIYLPVGNKAFIKGKLVHTNDVWVTLGSGWFLKTSSKKAIEICERRIKSADELIEKWEKENKLLQNMREYSTRKDAFESGGSKEIIEPFDEDKERQWQLEHREKEKRYKQQLKEVKEKTVAVSISTENDIWEHLEALELQEELEDELNRLGCDTETSSEDDSEDSSDSVTSNDKITNNENIIKEKTHENDIKIKKSSININSKITGTKKKTVSFSLPPANENRNIVEVSSKEHESRNIVEVSSKEHESRNIVEVSSKEHESRNIVEVSSKEHESSTVPNAISDTVYENVMKHSVAISDNKTKRPMSKFKKNRIEAK